MSSLFFEKKRLSDGDGKSSDSSRNRESDVNEPSDDLSVYRKKAWVGDGIARPTAIAASYKPKTHNLVFF